MSSNTSPIRFTPSPKPSLRILNVISAFVFLACMSGCSHPVEPQAPPMPPKDPRIYTWTIDSLSYSPLPQVGRANIQDLWGFNDTLLYAVCDDGLDGVATLWKYNGRSWNHVAISAREGGPMTQSFCFDAIKGFSERDIYVFGHRAYYDPTPTRNYRFEVCAAHFNGSVWQEITIPKGEYIFNVDHDSPSMIFCGGQNGQLFHYDGSRWTVDTITSPRFPHLKLNVNVAGATADNEVFIQTGQYDSISNSWRYWFSKYKHGHITSLDSSVDVPAWGGSAFWKSKEGNIFSWGWNGVNRWSGTKWTQFKGSYENVYSVYGISEKHLFVAERSNLFYYDGSRWTILNTGFSKTIYNAKIWCTENEAFVALDDGFRTYILHGK